MAITHNPHHCPLCRLRWAAAPEDAPVVSLVKTYV
jgi:hypothetical protein